MCPNRERVIKTITVGVDGLAVSVEMQEVPEHSIAKMLGAKVPVPQSHKKQPEKQFPLPRMSEPPPLLSLSLLPPYGCTDVWVSLWGEGEIVNPANEELQMSSCTCRT